VPIPLPLTAGTSLDPPNVAVTSEPTTIAGAVLELSGAVGAVGTVGAVGVGGVVLLHAPKRITVEKIAVYMLSRIVFEE
jgi:hypothetical protein